METEQAGRPKSKVEMFREFVKSAEESVTFWEEQAARCAESLAQRRSHLEWCRQGLAQAEVEERAG